MRSTNLLVGDLGVYEGLVLGFRVGTLVRSCLKLAARHPRV
jgi:hypothetical protein